ncbi:MAG: FG-GAP-like repeat-containing protein [Candidatus Poribacteria bacterium]|nr:FG-GAP-like repeat-containing protein [Candidatus Poribacteria bacterium]
MKNKNISIFIIFLVGTVPLLSSAAVQFVDVTAEAGINFRHINGAEGAYHLPETLGAGGAFFDADNDGYLDIYLVNSGYWDKSSSVEKALSVLYRNNGNGTFADITTTAGVGNRGNYGQGAACADYNNDGDVDLYVTNFGVNVLYRNNGDGTFTDVTRVAGVGDSGWSSSATFLDYNRDGHLDLFVVNYLVYSIDVPYLPCGEGETETYCHPSLFEGAPDRLYRNNGDGTFTDVSQEAGVGGIGGMFHGKGLGVVSADFNNDGAPDLYVANDDTRNDFFYNNGDGTFSEISLLAGCAYSFDGIAQAGMGVAVDDYNGDGWIDIFVTNLSYETNALYRNNGDGTFTDVIYESHLGKESFHFVGFGTGFLDADNDGWRDIFIANGHIIDNIEDTHDVLTYRQPNQLFRNRGDNTFREISKDAGDYFQRAAVSRGALFGDYDNDGDVDLLVTQSNAPVTLLRNESPTQHNWIRIKTAGVISNQDGIGTRVILTAGGHTQIQEVNPAASYLSSHDARLHFGLGTHAIVDRLEVRWQSGVVQVFENLIVNQEHVIAEFSDTPEGALFRGVWTDDIATLRNSNIDVNIKDERGRTPLHIAVENGYEDVTMFLVEKGAEVNIADANGNTPLILIIHQTGNLEIIRRLLEKGARINTQNRTGETALMYAAWRGHLEIVQLLLENRADVSLKNRQGDTALGLAESKGHLEIVQMLRLATE